MISTSFVVFTKFGDDEAALEWNFLNGRTNESSQKTGLICLVPFQLFGPNDGPRTRREHGESIFEGICLY
jgi:hypothetical protein